MAELVERTTALIVLRPGGAGGLAVPEMGRFTEVDGLLLARVAPGQVLAMRMGVDVPLLEELAPLVGAGALIDLSDARVGVRFAGAGAAARLATLVPIDLHASRFGPGQCAQTMAAHLSVLVLQHGVDAYELQCGRSFAGSFLRAVELAGG